MSVARRGWAMGLLMGVVPLRMGLDALWWVDGPLGVSLPAWASGLVAVGLVGLVAVRWRTVLSHPLRIPLAGLAGCLVVGAARADTALGGLTHGLHLGVPIVWVLALDAWWDERPAPRVWLGLGAVPVAVSLAWWAAGQPSEHLVNGWPRLLGWYGDMHPHAVVMAALGPGALALAADAPTGRARAAWAALGVAALVCLGATWVRTAMVFAGVTLVAWSVARGRWRASLGLVVAAALVALAVPELRERFSDVAAVLTGTAPEEGWGAVGSWRGRIWVDSASAWLAGGPMDVALGRGLGDHVGLHRHLEPHSGWLALLAQVGVAGWAAWHACMLVAVVHLWRRRADPDAALAFAWLVAAGITTPLSNDWLPRATVVWLAWGFAGVALSSSRRTRRARARCPAPGGSP